MNSSLNATAAKDIVSRRFTEAGIAIERIAIRQFPDETIVVVHVSSQNTPRGIRLANQIDHELAKQGFDGFVAVKEFDASSSRSGETGRVRGLADRRVTEFVNLLTARSRTSEIQPSLAYFPDAQNTVASVTAPRHHLIFGRRGAGKTALLVEAKNRIEKEGNLSLWINIQTMRHETAASAFLIFCQRLCGLVQSHFRKSGHTPQVLVTAHSLLAKAETLLVDSPPAQDRAFRLVPQVQSMIRRFLETSSIRLFVFLDDFHYLNRTEQPRLLDMVHGCVRDCDAWLKVAAIEHLARWFEPTQQLGLQSGHDAVDIDLDVTLQDPQSGKAFLEKVLLSYAEHCRISFLSSILAKGTLDRLVLASGAVPRDYLTLCGRGTQLARLRENAKQVGVQDVNMAAGDAKQKKLDELEDDAASAIGESPNILNALQQLRAFCIDEKSSTYFRIDYRDKEQRPDEYHQLEALMDLRFIHLIEPSLSDERRAGRRAEVYMLDLSQYVGRRLNRKLRVLDFLDGHLVVKSTGTKTPVLVGNTVNKRLSLLRRGSLFELERLSSTPTAAG